MREQRALGWGLVICGWGLYVLALFCPAVKVGIMGLDMYGEDVKPGYECCLDAFNLGNWLFAPPLALYAVGNVLMVGSLAAPLVPRRYFTGLSIAFFALFVVSLSAPWCAHEVKRVFIGCKLWMLSFLTVATGLLMVSRGCRQASALVMD